MWNGPTTVEGVATAGRRWLIASTRIETPSTSDMRMNSCRLSSHIFPTRVRKSMPANHSPSVGSTSRMKPCRCLTSEVTTSRSRGSGEWLKRSVARLVMFCSVVFLMGCSGGRLYRIYFLAANSSRVSNVYEHDDDSADRGAG